MKTIKEIFDEEPKKGSKRKLAGMILIFFSILLLTYSFFAIRMQENRYKDLFSIEGIDMTGVFLSDQMDLLVGNLMVNGQIEEVMIFRHRDGIVTTIINKSWMDHALIYRQTAIADEPRKE